MPRCRLPVLTALSLAAAVACSSDPYAPKATSEVLNDSLRVLALSGTAPEAQSGVRLITHSTEVPDFSEQFDFALDIDSLNNVRIIPRSRVVTCSSICQLGVKLIRSDSVTFENIFDAPKSGYTYDSTTVLPAGVTAVFVTKDVLCRSTNINTYDIYAKMIVDSTRLSDRSIFVRLVTDPNCGFRGLVPGTIPGH